MYGRRFVYGTDKVDSSVPRDLLENVKRNAKENNITITDLIEAQGVNFNELPNWF
jgi:hypothetical protein